MKANDIVDRGEVWWTNVHDKRSRPNVCELRKAGMNKRHLYKWNKWIEWKRETQRNNRNIERQKNFRKSFSVDHSESLAREEAVKSETFTRRHLTIESLVK